VLSVAGALVTVKLTATPGHQAAGESAAPVAVVLQVTTVPTALLSRADPGQAATPLQKATTTGPPLIINGKLAIVFVSEESCPFCAAERWPLTVALSHFGTWSQLGITKSSATDAYPNTATLSFRAARYRSAELALRSTELTDNAGHPLQAQTPLDAKLIGTYDVPPYVNSADQSGAVPFLDIGNQYILAERSTTRSEHELTLDISQQESGWFCPCPLEPALARPTALPAPSSRQGLEPASGLGPRWLGHIGGLPARSVCRQPGTPGELTGPRPLVPRPGPSARPPSPARA
jgi:hypothetical protein